MPFDDTNPFALIIHRDFIGDVQGFLDRVGGIFSDAYHCWIGGRFEFVAMVVNSPEALRTRKPKVYYVENARELLQVIEQSHAECAPPIDWRCCVVRESATHMMLAQVLPAEHAAFLRLDHVWSEKTLRDVEARREAKAEATRKKNRRKYLVRKKAAKVIARAAKKAAKAKAAKAKQAAKTKAGNKRARKAAKKPGT